MLRNCCTALAGLLLAGGARGADPYIAPNLAKVATPLLSQGRPDDAMRGLEARVGTNPFDAVSMNNLAAVKASKGDWYGAAELLVRAHRLAPDNGVIAGNLDQLNQYLDSRAAPPKAADTTTVVEGAVWPEPPPMWGATITTVGDDRRAAPAPAARAEVRTSAPVVSHHRRRRHTRQVRSVPQAAVQQDSVVQQVQSVQPVAVPQQDLIVQPDAATQQQRSALVPAPVSAMPGH